MPAATQRWTVVTAVALLAAGFAGCSNGRAQNASSNSPASATASTTASTAASTTASTAASTTASTAKPTTTAKPPPPGLGPGAKGDQVKALEEKLGALKYSVGPADGTYDSLTTEGVIAFQKVTGMARTGRATDDVLAAVAAAKVPDPMMPDGGATRVEVDLKRQVLFLYENGTLTRTLMVSTGGGYRYCIKGACDTAITPGGSFRIGRKISGKHVAPLGTLYNPLFFNGGIAIHGAPSVPTVPVSHGCVRIPMSASRWFFDRVQPGTPVYVLGGPKAPVPFNTPGPGGEPPEEPQSPPSTAPSSTTTTLPTATSTPVTTPATSTTSTTTAPTTTTSSSTTTSTTAPNP